MGVIEESWPELRADGSLAGFRSSPLAPASKDEPPSPRALTTAPENSSIHAPLMIETILERLEAADTERHEILKDTRWLNVRVMTLEQSLRLAIDANDAMRDSIESCFRELRESDDRLSPRLEVLEAGLADFASRIEQTNHDALSTRIESQTASSQINERITEMLEWLNETQVMAARASGNANITANQIDELVLDLNEVAAKISLLATLPDEVASVSNQLSSVTNEVESISTQTERVDRTLNSRLASVSDQLAQVRQQAEELSSAAVTSEAELAAVSRDLEATAFEATESRRAISKLTGNIEDVTGNLETVTGNLAAIEELVEETETRLTKNIANNTSEISDVETQLTNVTKNIAEQQDQLESIETELSQTQTAQQLDKLRNETRAATQLAQEAQTTAYKAKDRAEHAATSAEELRADLEAEQEEADDSNERALEEALARLSIALERLDAVETRTQKVQGIVTAANLDSLRSEVDSSAALVQRIIDMLAGETSVEAADDEIRQNDRHRNRWEEHVKQQAELRRQRARSSEQRPRL